MNRRKFITYGVSSTCAALTGCTMNSRSNLGSSTTTFESSKSPKQVPIQDSINNVGSENLIKNIYLTTIIYFQGQDFGIPYGKAGEQYLLLNLREERGGEFSLELDGEAFPPQESIEEKNLGSIRWGFEINPSERPVPIIGFTLSRDVEYSSGFIEFTPQYGTKIQYNFSQEFIHRINNPEIWKVNQFNTPEIIKKNQSFEVDIQVENAGGRKGIFTASLAPKSEEHSQTIRREISPGTQEKIVKTINFPWPNSQSPNPDQDTETYVVDWGFGSVESTVKIEDSQ